MSLAMSTALHASNAQALAAVYDQASTPKVRQGMKLVAMLNLRPGANVLEIGAGTGRLASHVAELVRPGGHVTAIDPQPSRVGFAAARGKTNISAVVSEADNLWHFAPERFDAVYMNSVFHWVANRPRALEESFRVLKPGGRIALNSANPEHPHEFTRLVRQAVYAQAPNADWQWDGAHGISPGGMESALLAAGFGNITITKEEFTDIYDSVESLLALSFSSSYGNLTLPAQPNSVVRARIMSDLRDRLEAYRTPDGFRLRRHMIFAAAGKPG